MKSTSSQSPKFAANVPDSVKTPDVVETERLGRLQFFDGMPSDETVRKVYDQLDFSRGVETFLTGCPAASIHAFLRGMKQAGMATFSMGIHEQMLEPAARSGEPARTALRGPGRGPVQHDPHQ